MSSLRDVNTYLSHTLDFAFSDATQGFVAFTDTYGNTWWSAREIKCTTLTDDTKQRKINAVLQSNRQSHDYTSEPTDLINSLIKQARITDETTV